ncbi:MAG: ATP-binding protein [Pseudomonadota bacterium]
MSADTQSLLTRHLELVLMGAAKVLGCNSATLLIIDEDKKELKLWVATLFSEQIKSLEQATEILGWDPKGATVPTDIIGESIVLRSYREGKVLETPTIADILGELVSGEVSKLLVTLIGKHRFSSLPVMSSSGVEAVILFSKKGDRPFTFQQRSLQLEYASRLGLMIESEKRAEEMVAFRQKLMTASELIPPSLKRVLSIETEAMLALDGAQTIVAANQRAEEMFAAKSGQLLGSPFEVLFEDEEAARKVLEFRLRLPADGHMEMKAKMKRRNGMTFGSLVSGVLALDEEGKGAGAIIRIKETPEEKREMQDDLKGGLMRSERLAMIGEMASQMAHEIRNPLVSIGAALSVVKEDLPEDDALRGELELVIDEVDRLDTIIRDYLSLARRVVGRVERVSLEDALNEAARMVSRNPSSSGIDIRVSAARPCDVMGDFDALKQVFMNLLLNAVEASAKGSAVECTVQRKGGDVQILILDRGEGVSSKSIDHLFEPFYTTKSKGSGLGLTISKNIIDELGGKMSLNPRKGGGCEAVVNLRVVR